ncbi:MBL fold metallo-hydrolase [Bosea sp. PAMC 26642]|uniref:MBL fold metallo-hydrolase n=1 Tax=Bosea sp. (strain PAMC 26642) TaxID=1792307 RepID=UPI000770026B|nr:MBL fold metallo-hydrolase [Bosea sp. PAMC 26642]AMJ61558.1 hypothetical protein AXW83_15715 [Bosea sp. PAMC 26642]
MLIGDISVTRIGEFEGPRTKPEVLFPDFDRQTFERHLNWLAPDHYDPTEDRLMASFHSWLIRMPGLTVLVDTCAGNHKERPNNPGFHRLETPWLERLAEAGVAPEQVDIVMCTHLHVDHCGWNTRLRNGHWVPTFPNARYIFSCDELDHADTRRNPRRADDPNAGVFEDSVLPILLSGQASPVAGAHAINDALLIEPAPGHTVGSVTLRLTSAGRQGLFIGDIMHHPIQVYRPDWNSRYCEMPDAAIRTRRRILAESADADIVLLPAHFAAPHAGYVNRSGSNFSFRFADGDGMPRRL